MCENDNVYVITPVGLRFADVNVLCASSPGVSGMVFEPRCEFSLNGDPLHLHVPDQFREEDMKIVVKPEFVFCEDPQGAREVELSSQPAAHSFQGISDSGDLRIRSEPILLAHAIQDSGGVCRKFRQAHFNFAVNVINELTKGERRIFRPVAREKMIEVDVGEDGSEAAVGRWKSPSAGFPSWMRVGEGVDLAVTPDSLLVILR